LIQRDIAAGEEKGSH